MDGMGWVGWDLCVGLFYEHRFAMLIISQFSRRDISVMIDDSNRY